MAEQPSKMLAAVYYSNSDIRIQQVDVPNVGAGEVLVKIAACGICGSDVLEWYRVKKAPVVLGHEAVGQICAIGEDVSRFKVGQKVALAHHVPCNTCKICRRGHPTACQTLRETNFVPGGFCQFTKMPPINVDRGIFPIPDGVSYEEATFTEPLACVLRGQRNAGLKPGDNVLVIGCGIAGILHIALARATGVGRVVATDISEYRIKKAIEFGAEVAVKADEDISSICRKTFNGYLADRVIICTGASRAQTQALECVERGGTVVFFAPTLPGVTVPLNLNELFFRNDVTLTTSYAGSPADYADALELIATGVIKVKKMITHILPLKETQKGFSIVAKADESIKVIIKPEE